MVSSDLVLGLLVTSPGAAFDPPESEVHKVAGDEEKAELRKRLDGLVHGKHSRVFVGLEDQTFGVAGGLRCSHPQLFHSLCAFEAWKEGKDWLGLGKDEEEIVLVKQEIFWATLCRSLARQKAWEALRPFLGDDGTCLFAQGEPVAIGSPETAGPHYLELILGRGPQDKCPLAEQYLQGVSRDMPLSQVPYYCAVLEGRVNLGGGDSVLTVLQRLDADDSVPLDLREDLALVVARHALELVQALGFDL